MSSCVKTDSIVLGISKDRVASHDAFREKYDLGIALLSGADSDVSESYGVWQEKTINDKIFMGIMRTAFPINAQGTIAHVWNDVDVNGHGEVVLAAAQKL